MINFQTIFLLLLIIQKTPPSLFTFLFSPNLRETLFCYHTSYLPRSDYFRFLFFDSLEFQNPLLTWPQFQPYPPKPEFVAISKCAIFPLDSRHLNKHFHYQTMLHPQPPLLSLFKPSPKVSFSLSLLWITNAD